jgi:zinc and cadmium transporter
MLAHPLVQALLASAIISAIPLMLLPFYILIKKYLKEFVSFAAGVFLGSVFLLALPHLAESKEFKIVSAIILISFLTFLLIEYFLHFHHHGEKNHKHHLGVINLIGDFIHNFVDGMGIIAAFKMNPHLGISTAIAIAAHEVPQEFGDFSILIYSGFSKIKAVLLNFLVALTAILGVIIGYFIKIEAPYLLAITVGSFLYLGAADLVPLMKENNKNKKEFIKNFIILISGALFIFLISISISHHH